MPNDQCRGKWTENDFRITEWYHRSLDTMVMNLAYINDADGKPVPGNETRWSDDDFAKLLKQPNRISSSRA